MPELNKISLVLGCGSAEFPMEKGSFEYIDHISDQRDADPEAVTFESTGEEAFVLRIRPQDKKWNRFYLKVPTDLLAGAPQAGGEKEHFYGTGETFSEFDLAGQKVRVWVAEHQNSKRIARKLELWEKNGPEPERPWPFSDYETYYAQPTFTSSRRYYLHADTTGYVGFDFTEPGYVGIELRENAPIYVERARSFEELSGKLSRRLGHQRPLPDWVHDGVILGIEEGPAAIDEKIAKVRAAGTPVTGIWSQDWCGCRRTGFGYQVMWNWCYDKDLYPDLPEHIRRWRKEGIRFLGYINPFMAIEKDIYAYATAHGYCVKDKDGKDYLVTITTFPAAMIDLTNPEAWKWYKGLIKENMIGIGLSGWMADFGEYLPTDCVLHSGEDPEKLHNDWPALWARLNQEAIREAGAEDEVFFFTRAGSAGTIRYSSMMWNGDQHVDWSLDDGLASVIPATLSLAMSGYGMTHSDVGGYTTMGPMTRGAELMMRWEEMNSFSPLMRSHPGNQPSRSIQFDAREDMIRHLSLCVRRFTALKDYLQMLEADNAEKGVPMRRPLFYHYDEPSAYEEKFEYLLGRDLLVAPVIKEGAVEREVYLPEDEWVHLWTGEICRGGRIRVQAPLGQIPVFYRKESSWKAVFQELREIQ